MHSGWKIAALLALAAFALGSLVVGAPYLETALPGGLPLGNALAALALCAIAACGASIARRGLVRKLSLLALLVAMAWLPVSIAMAGNLTLVFSGARGDAWIAWSAGVAIATVTSLALAVVQRIVLAAWPHVGVSPRER